MVCHRTAIAWASITRLVQLGQQHVRRASRLLVSIGRVMVVPVTRKPLCREPANDAAVHRDGLAPLSPTDKRECWQHQLAVDLFVLGVRIRRGVDGCYDPRSDGVVLASKFGTVVGSDEVPIAKHP